MDNIQIVKKLKKSSFFQALNKKSRNDLLKKWETLSDGQIRKILFLTLNESLMIQYLGQIGHNLIKETRAKASREMVKKVETANASCEEKVLNDVMKNNDL